MFELTNALGHLSMVINSIFKPMLRKGVLVFFNDILPYNFSGPTTATVKGINYLKD